MDVCLDCLSTHREGDGLLVVMPDNGELADEFSPSPDGTWTQHPNDQIRLVMIVGVLYPGLPDNAAVADGRILHGKAEILRGT